MHVPRECTLQQLADLVGGRVVGNPDLLIRTLNGIDFAADGEITWLWDRGRIIERGTHTDLLSAQGRYAAMWQLQQQTGD